MTKRMNLTRCLAVAVSAIVTVFAGCADNGLNLARVRGKVTYKGQPIKNGTVFFMADDTKGTVGPPAVGPITEDGSYVMSTETSGDGAIVGSHKVGITGIESEPISGADAADPEADPDSYLKGKAKAAAQAVAQGEGRSKKGEEIFTDRGGRKWRFVIPRKFSDPNESGIMAKVERGSNTLNFDIDGAGNVTVNK